MAHARNAHIREFGRLHEPNPAAEPHDGLVNRPRATNDRSAMEAPDRPVYAAWRSLAHHGQRAICATPENPHV
jgi:hypothetical protein